MNIIADTHTHTLLCDHAYSTLTENCAVAAQRGLKVVCSTEHTPEMLGAPTYFYFGNLDVLPRQTHGVTVLRGAEANIMDFQGTLDLHDRLLEKLEWVIASLHIPCINPGTKQDHTDAWLAVAKNPLVHVIGHCGDPRYDFDKETAVKAFAEHGKVVEINSNSFVTRAGSYNNCKRVAELCKKYSVPVVVSSDAHFADTIGRVQPSIELLKSIDFPEELVLNSDYQRFAAHVNTINKTTIFTDVIDIQ